MLAGRLVLAVAQCERGTWGKQEAQGSPECHLQGLQKSSQTSRTKPRGGSGIKTEREIYRKGQITLLEAAGRCDDMQEGAHCIWRQGSALLTIGSPLLM